jgi:hypothetical protein
MEHPGSVSLPLRPSASAREPRVGLQAEWDLPRAGTRRRRGGRDRERLGSFASPCDSCGCPFLLCVSAGADTDACD